MLTGCAGSAGVSGTGRVSTPMSTSSLHEQLELLPAAEAVTGGDAGITIEVAAGITRGDILAMAEEAHALATERHFLEDIWITRMGAGFDAESDTSTPPPWTFQVYPGEIETTLATVAGVLDVEEIAGTSGFSIIDGWPYVTIANVTEFSSIFDAVSATSLFAGGGTYSTNSDHLQIVHVPTRTSAEAVHAIADIAIDYPNAEVLLQATTAGPQWPKLYVARLSTEEAAAIEARLLSPELADTDPDGLPQRFQLSVVGPEGPVYTLGTLGNVTG